LPQKSDGGVEIGIPLTTRSGASAAVLPCYRTLLPSFFAAAMNLSISPNASRRKSSQKTMANLSERSPSAPERPLRSGLSPALVSDVYLAWRKNAALSPAATALVDAVRRMSAK